MCSLLRRTALAVFALVALAPAASRAQEAEAPRRVVLADGSVIVGEVRGEEKDTLVVRSANGVEQRVARAQVREVAALYAGRFTRLDPNRTRLFVTPTARTLGRGSGRVSTFLYILPGVAYGVADGLDVSAAATIPAIGSGVEGVNTLVNLNVKGRPVQIGGGGLALGASALIPISTTEGSPGIGGTFYGLATLGSETQAFTVGLIGFYGTDLEDFEAANGGVLVLGYEAQLSSSIKFITENGVAFGSGEVGGGTLTGIRFFGERVTADLALVAVGADGEFFLSPIPYVGFAYNFGR